MGYIQTTDGRRIKDISGQKFNKLTAIKYDHADKNHHSYWLFKCDCGNEKVICANAVTKKNAEVKSCGCQNNAVRLSGNNRRVHGDNNTRLYNVWCSMRNRCNNPNSESYKKWYGVNNIKICPEWDDYKVFKQWAFTHGYDENADYMKCTLDRINPEKDYCPENCRWVDAKVQARNKLHHHYIYFNGEYHTAIEWEEITGIKSSVIRSRLYNFGWSIEEALTIPIGVRRKDWG